LLLLFRNILICGFTIVQIPQELLQIHLINFRDIFNSAKLLHITTYTLQLIPEKDTRSLKFFPESFIHRPMTLNPKIGFHARKILENIISIFA